MVLLSPAVPSPAGPRGTGARRDARPRRHSQRASLRQGSAGSWSLAPAPAGREAAERLIGGDWGPAGWAARRARPRGSADGPGSAAGERSLENVAGRPRLDSLSSVEEDDYDTLADIDYDKNVIRTKVRPTPRPPPPRRLLPRRLGRAPPPAFPSSNTSAWPTWPARTSGCCGRSTRSTSGEWGQRGWGAQSSGPAWGGWRSPPDAPRLPQEHRHHCRLLRPPRHPARHHLPDGKRGRGGSKGGSRELCGLPVTGTSLGVPRVPSRAPLLSPCPCAQVVNVTGNQDICYYNFLCAHPLGNLRWVQGSRWVAGGPLQPRRGSRCPGEGGEGSAAPTGRTVPSQRLQQHPQQPGLRPAGLALPAHHPAAGDQLQPGTHAQ